MRRRRSSIDNISSEDISSGFLGLWCFPRATLDHTSLGDVVQPWPADIFNYFWLTYLDLIMWICHPASHSPKSPLPGSMHGVINRVIFRDSGEHSEQYPRATILGISGNIFHCWPFYNGFSGPTRSLRRAVSLTAIIADHRDFVRTVWWIFTATTLDLSRVFNRASSG